MTSEFLAQAIFIDTSAAMVIDDPQSQYYVPVKTCFETYTSAIWSTLNLTAFETYTRVRYDKGFKKAIRLYTWLKGADFEYFRFTKEDEQHAYEDLKRFNDQKLSFHDALLATVMKRLGVYRILTLDKDFFLYGFEVLPGITIKKS